MLLVCVHVCVTGIRCELCEDSFYGDPLGWRGEVQLCVRCECNENTDPNAVGVCDHVTGRCLKCLGNTDGDQCEKCQSGYYGNALDRSLRPSQKCLRECVCMHEYIYFQKSGMRGIKHFYDIIKNNYLQDGKNNSPSLQVISCHPIVGYFPLTKCPVVFYSLFK